jgi:hypothetical protein
MNLEKFHTAKQALQAEYKHQQEQLEFEEDLLLLGEFAFDEENRLLFEDICRVYWLIEKYVVAKMDPQEVVKRDLERIKVLKQEGYT